MASRRELVEYVVSQLGGAGEVCCRAMMGEYVLYYRGKIIGGVYDDRLLIKPVASARALLPKAELVEPYHGAKALLWVEEVDDAELLCRLAVAMYPELPLPKARKR